MCSGQGEDGLGLSGEFCVASSDGRTGLTCISSFGTFGRFRTPKTFRFYSLAGKAETPVLCGSLFPWNSDDVRVFVDD